ncbi:MAG: redoxin family protein [Pirellulales bacterium]
MNITTGWKRHQEKGDEMVDQGARGLGDSPDTVHQPGVCRAPWPRGLVLLSWLMSLVGLGLLPGCGGHAAKSPVEVYVFVQADCPIANRFIPELNAIARDYADRGVRMTLVYPDPDETDEVVGKHQEEFKIVAPVLRDPSHQWVDRFGVRVTPEAVVVGRDGRVKYQGRVNDQFVGYTQGRREPQRHDLRLALDAVLAGREPEVSKTEAVGCLIVDLKP